MKQVQEGFINYESNRWQFNLINNYYYPKQFGVIVIDPLQRFP